MSARKLNNPHLFEAFTLEPSITQLELPEKSVCFRKNGIEFISDSPIPVWTEMTVALQTPEKGKSIHCTGIIVECQGDSQTGYTVSMLFTNLTQSAAAHIDALV